MNILVANLSLLTKKEEHHYKVKLKNCSKDTITAVHTNESILKCVCSLNDVINSGGIGRIILLVSNATIADPKPIFDDLTTIEYFGAIVQNLCPNAEIIQIRTENDDKSDRDTSVILNEICAAISKEDTIYIDGAGGKRTTSNIIQLLTKILSYTGINSPLTLYANILNSDNDQDFIADNSEFELMTSLADGFHEFMTTGKADQLRFCSYELDQDSEFIVLIKQMCRFSDKIRIGDVDKIDHTITDLTKSVKGCQKIRTPNTIVGVILQQFLPVIEKKIVGDNTNGIDYVKLISWCLDNMLIQQALTIFVEKLPISVFKKRILIYKGNEKIEKEEYKHKRKKSDPLNWETYVFYKDCIEGCFEEKINFLHDETEDNTIARKLAYTNKIMQEGFKNSNYTSTISNSRLAKMFYGYIYVKSLRNQINHASSDEILSARQKKMLEPYGYDIHGNGIRSIRKNIELALREYNFTLSKLEGSQINNTSIEPVITPTILKEGDVAKAISIEGKTIRIENHPYDIQLVLPKYSSVSCPSAPPFNVKIKQISKSGKITQVELI